MRAAGAVREMVPGHLGAHSPFLGAAPALGPRGSCQRPHGTGDDDAHLSALASPVRVPGEVRVLLVPGAEGDGPVRAVPAILAGVDALTERTHARYGVELAGHLPGVLPAPPAIAPPGPPAAGPPAPRPLLP